jgi:arabinogalactan endo-1,4-beta-galactosidase
MLVGGDVSALERLEQAGAVYEDSGRPGDGLAILRARGANTFRLRIFVNPNDSDVQVNDLAYTIRMAARVKASGARLLLDFHYSDTWADPGHQLTPVAWAGLSFDSLESEVERYSADVIRQLDQAGSRPDVVQIGNEVESGMLWPLGRVGGSFDTPSQWEQFTRLLKAGIRGVRGGVPAGDSVRVMIHVSTGGNADATRWFFDHLAAAGVSYDLIGLSYYPWWHGSMAGLVTNLRSTSLRYGTDVMVVETAYPWRSGDWEGMVTDASAMVWPASRAGQASFLRALLAAVSSTPGGHGAGVLWWYPEAVAVPGVYVWANGSLGLFDSAGAVLPAAAELGPYAN